MKLYMAVTADKFELPLAVEVSTTQLSKKTGISKESISFSICKKRSGKNNGIKFIKIEVDDD